MTHGRLSVMALAGGLLAVSVAIASAQVRWGSGVLPRHGVCFYEHEDMRGRYFCVAPGQSLPSLPGGMSDAISSIRVLGRAEVVVFRDVRFRGPSARFGSNIDDLRRQGWNDRISSLRVTAPEGGWAGRPPVWGNDPMPREGACFYKDAGFRGPHFCLPRGASDAMVPREFNDQISSIRLRGAVVVIFADRDFRGRSTRLTSDVDNLRGSWNDAVSSIRVF